MMPLCSPSFQRWRTEGANSSKQLCPRRAAFWLPGKFQSPAIVAPFGPKDPDDALSLLLSSLALPTLPLAHSERCAQLDERVVPSPRDSGSGWRTTRQSKGDNTTWDALQRL